jgi:hypothetical protein
MRSSPQTKQSQKPPPVPLVPLVPAVPVAPLVPLPLSPALLFSSAGEYHEEEEEEEEEEEDSCFRMFARAFESSPVSCPAMNICPVWRVVRTTQQQGVRPKSKSIKE